MFFFPGAFCSNFVKCFLLYRGVGWKGWLGSSASEGVICRPFVLLKMHFVLDFGFLCSGIWMSCHLSSGKWQVALVFQGRPFLSHVCTTALSRAWSCVRLLHAATGDPLALLSMKLCVSFLKESHSKGETFAPLTWLEKILSVSCEGHFTVGKYGHRDSW